MKSTTKTTLAALAAALIGLGAADARSAATTTAPEIPAPGTYGFSYCGNGISINVGGGHQGNIGHDHYRTRTRCIDHNYYCNGCYRYCRYIYLHERIDHCGRVVHCWKTHKTVCLGRIH